MRNTCLSALMLNISAGEGLFVCPERGGWNCRVSSERVMACSALVSNDTTVPASNLDNGQDAVIVRVLLFRNAVTQIPTAWMG